jgi:peptidyl-prolyl cis-trans isomerase B (cyclophilin B)
MKKLLSVLLVLSLALSLAACGKEPAEVYSEPEASEPSDAASSSSSPSSSQKPGAAENSANEEAAKLNAAIKPGDVSLIQFDDPQDDTLMATITTSAGDIVVALYPEKAPRAVENFVTHAENGYYNGLDFYKAIDGFLIQSGAPDGAEPESVFLDDKGEPVPFESEFSLDLWNFRGALTMVNEGADRPDTNTSEFFIVQADSVSGSTLDQMEEIGYPEKVLERYKDVGGVPGFDWHNTVFGMVTEGMDVVDGIAAGEAEETVIIESITIEGEFDFGGEPEDEESSEEESGSEG